MLPVSTPAPAPAELRLPAPDADGARGVQRSYPRHAWATVPSVHSRPLPFTLNPCPSALPPASLPDSSPCCEAASWTRTRGRGCRGAPAGCHCHPRPRPHPRCPPHPLHPPSPQMRSRYCRRHCQRSPEERAATREVLGSDTRAEGGRRLGVGRQANAPSPFTGTRGASIVPMRIGLIHTCFLAQSASRWALLVANSFRYPALNLPKQLRH